jgi:hypothetical protein
MVPLIFKTIGISFLAERVKRKYRILFTHHPRPSLKEYVPVLVMVFSIIGSTKRCQMVFQRQIAVILADLDIHQRITFAWFLKFKRHIGSLLLYLCGSLI